MVKLAALLCASSFLLLSACTQQSATDKASTNDDTKQNQTLRIAAAANLSEVLPTIIKLSLIHI